MPSSPLLRAGIITATGLPVTFYGRPLSLTTAHPEGPPPTTPFTASSAAASTARIEGRAHPSGSTLHPRRRTPYRLPWALRYTPPKRRGTQGERVVCAQGRRGTQGERVVCAQGRRGAQRERVVCAQGRRGTQGERVVCAQGRRGTQRERVVCARRSRGRPWRRRALVSLVAAGPRRRLRCRCGACPAASPRAGRSSRSRRW